MALWRCWLEPTGSGGGRKKADVVMSVNVNLSADGVDGEKERSRVDGWFEGTVESMRIVDCGLFGDSDE